MSDSAQVARQAYERFANGDIDGILAMMSDDVRWEVPKVLPQGGSFEGRDGVGEFFAGVVREWPELQVESEELVADGDQAVSLGRARGKRPSGENAEWSFSHVFTVRNGKIVRFREYAAVDEKLS